MLQGVSMKIANVIGVVLGFGVVSACANDQPSVRYKTQKERLVTASSEEASTGTETHEAGDDSSSTNAELSEPVFFAREHWQLHPG